MNPYSTELCHHGILGQRWGKKNGPPYPLDAEDHSSSEKKAGWRKSIDDVKKKDVKGGVTKAVSKVKDKYNSLSDRNKTIVKRAGAAAVVLATVSAAQTAKNAGVANEILGEYGRMSIKYVVGKGAVQAGKVAAVTALATVGAHKLYDAIPSKSDKSIDKTIQKINKDYYKDPEIKTVVVIDKKTGDHIGVNQRLLNKKGTEAAIEDARNESSLNKTRKREIEYFDKAYNAYLQSTGNKDEAYKKAVENFHENTGYTRNSVENLVKKYSSIKK